MKKVISHLVQIKPGTQCPPNSRLTKGLILSLPHASQAVRVLFLTLPLFLSFTPLPKGALDAHFPTLLSGHNEGRGQ